MHARRHSESLLGLADHAEPPAPYAAFKAAAAKPVAGGTTAPATEAGAADMSPDIPLNGSFESALWAAAAGAAMVLAVTALQQLQGRP